MTPIVQPVDSRRKPFQSMRKGARANMPVARVRSALFVAVIAAFVACGPVRLVSPYDEVIDKGTSEIHTRVVAFIDRMTSVAGKPEGAYSANVTFYGDVKASIATLKLRAAAQGKNEITTLLVAELATNIENPRKLHESGKDGGSYRALQPFISRSG
jgi:hypothetical protein